MINKNTIDKNKHMIDKNKINELHGKISARLVARARNVQKEKQWFKNHQNKLCFSCYREFVCWRQRRGLRPEESESCLLLRDEELERRMLQVV